MAALAVRPSAPTRTRPSAKALARKAWIDLDMPAGHRAGLPQARRRAAHRGRPQAPPRPPAAQRQPLDRRAQRARRRHPPHPSRCCRRTRRRRPRRALPCSCAPRTRSKLHRPSCRHSRRPTGASPCRRPRPCAGRRRRRRPGRSCWPSRKAQAAVKPDGWWEERRANAYAALQARQAQDGLRPRAQSRARSPSMPARTRPSWPAGWRCATCKDAKLALGHFEALAKAADGPLSHARGQYWLGRTHETLGDKAKAQEHYRAASAYFDTFHGQLARLKLDPKARAPQDRRRRPRRPRRRSPASTARMPSRPPCSRARPASTSAWRARSSIHLRNHLKSEAEVAMLAHLAEALGDTQMAVRIGKTAIARGLNLFYYAYPDPLAAGLHAAAPAARARRHLRHRPPGERVQLADACRARARAASCRSCR